MRDALSDFTGTVRRAVDDYRMIQEGDRVAVGVSGGKDSMVLPRAQLPAAVLPGAVRA